MNAMLLTAVKYNIRPRQICVIQLADGGWHVIMIYNPGVGIIT